MTDQAIVEVGVGARSAVAEAVGRAMAVDAPVTLDAGAIGVAGKAAVGLLNQVCRERGLTAWRDQTTGHYVLAPVDAMEGTARLGRLVITEPPPVEVRRRPELALDRTSGEYVPASQWSAYDLRRPKPVLWSITGVRRDENGDLEVVRLRILGSTASVARQIAESCGVTPQLTELAPGPLHVHPVRTIFAALALGWLVLLAVGIAIGVLIKLA